MWSNLRLLVCFEPQGLLGDAANHLIMAEAIDPSYKVFNPLSVVLFTMLTFECMKCFHSRITWPP